MQSSVKCCKLQLSDAHAAKRTESEIFAAFRLREERLAIKSAILIKLLARTAEPTNSSTVRVHARGSVSCHDRGTKRTGAPQRQLGSVPLLELGTLFAGFALRSSLAATQRNARHLDAALLARTEIRLTEEAPISAI